MLLDQINGIIKVWDYLVHDAYEMHSDFELGDHVEEAPADESWIFFEQLEAASPSLYEGSLYFCLFIVIRLLSIKLDWNTPQGAVDFMIDLRHELVDPNIEIPDNFLRQRSWC